MKKAKDLKEHTIKTIKEAQAMNKRDQESFGGYAYHWSKGDKFYVFTANKSASFSRCLVS